MKRAVYFESRIRCTVTPRRTWWDRLLGRKPDPRWADKVGWQQEWIWSATQRAVDEDTAEAIEREWAALGELERAVLA